MVVEFTPKTDEEIQRERCLPAGEYDFSVYDCEETVSKAGNPMLAVHLDVYDGASQRRVRDWIVFSMAFKVKHFLYSLGLAAKYDAGAIDAEDIVGKSGKVKISVEESDQYGAQNRVKDYVPADNATQAAEAIVDEVNSGDDFGDVPF